MHFGKKAGTSRLRSESSYKSLQEIHATFLGESRLYSCRGKRALPSLIVNGQERIGMITANKLSHPEIREKVTSSIFHLLATLPEAHKNIFIWKHYYGWPEHQIASRLGCSSSDVENTLQEISRTVIRRTEAIMLESGSLGESSQPQGMCATCCA